jgi:ribosomal protein S11
MANQPDRKTYGFRELELFTTYNRDSYKTKFGVQAPAYDATRAAKGWLDSTALVGRKAETLVEYTVFENNAFSTLALTAGEAATVNLTGRYEYAPYAPAATVATTFNGVGINPRVLASAADAQAVANSLAAAGAKIVSVVADTSIETNWGTETRRRYEITFGDGVVCDASGLLAEQYIAGVGAPGHWVIIPGSEPVWVVEAQDDGSKAGAAVPVPVRLLFGNERLVIGWGGVAAIERTDLDGTGESTTTDSAKALAALAADTAAIKTSLASVAADIARIKTRLGIA